MIIKKQCPICNKDVTVTKETNLGAAGLVIVNYSCGHYRTQKKLKTTNLQLVSADGDEPFPYQIVGATAALNGGMRFLLGDEQGLGKTVQFLMAVHSNPDEFCPFLLVCKASLVIQHMKETVRWCGRDFMPQILTGEDHYVFPDMKGYIISLDMLRRFKDLEGFVRKLNIKTLVVDEVQNIKNRESARTKAVQQLSQHTPYMLGMSGTAIKNHAGEYFPILNMLRPDKIQSLSQYQREWVDCYYSGYTMKYGGIKDPAKFKEFTKDFILRRTRAEVQHEIKLKCGDKPNRTFRFSALGPDVEAAYAAKHKEFADYYNSSNGQKKSFEFQSNILKYLNEMRHLVGYAKIDPTVDYVEEFIEDKDEGEKIVVFTHHKDVHQVLLSRLKQLQEKDIKLWGKYIASFVSGQSLTEIASTVELFRSPDCRVMVASTLAAGEGLNLQFCADMVMAERQWNPANEEQPEGRFLRIGQEALVVNAVYMVAVGTVDEKLSKLVEKKRSIVKNTLDGVNIPWDESNLVQELAEILAATGGKEWGN